MTGKLQLESRSDLEAVELVDGSFGVLRLSEADEAVSLGIAVGVRIVGAGELHGIDTSELIEEFGDLVLLKTSRDVLHVKVVELNVSRLTFRAAFMLSHHNFFSFKFESVEFIDGPLGILFLLKMHEAVSAGSAVVEELDLARVDVSATTEEVGEFFLVNGGLKILDEEVALLHVLAVFFLGEPHEAYFLSLEVGVVEKIDGTVGVFVLVEGGVAVASRLESRALGDLALLYSDALLVEELKEAVIVDSLGEIAYVQFELGLVGGTSRRDNNNSLF